MSYIQKVSNGAPTEKESLKLTCRNCGYHPLRYCGFMNPVHVIGVIRDYLYDCPLCGMRRLIVGEYDKEWLRK